jgi:hypothetical protein
MTRLGVGVHHVEKSPEIARRRPLRYRRRHLQLMRDSLALILLVRDRHVTVRECGLWRGGDAKKLNAGWRARHPLHQAVESHSRGTNETFSTGTTYYSSETPEKGAATCHRDDPLVRRTSCGTVPSLTPMLHRILNAQVPWAIYTVVLKSSVVVSLASSTVKSKEEPSEDSSTPA